MNTFTTESPDPFGTRAYLKSADRTTPISRPITHYSNRNRSSHQGMHALVLTVKEILYANPFLPIQPATTLARRLD
jgi:hypothetical protein